jgi:hypothetical protein
MRECSYVGGRLRDVGRTIMRIPTWTFLAVVFTTSTAIAASSDANPWRIPASTQDVLIFADAAKIGRERSYRVCQKQGPQAVIIADDGHWPLVLNSCTEVVVRSLLSVQRAKDTTTSEISGTYQLLAAAGAGGN